MGAGSSGCLSPVWRIVAGVCSGSAAPKALEWTEEDGVLNESETVLDALRAGAAAAAFGAPAEGGAPPRMWSACSQGGRAAQDAFATKAVDYAGDVGDAASAAESGIGFTSHKGVKPRGMQSPNQDSFFVLHVENRLSMYGVFDGHGMYGHQVSEFVKAHLPRMVVKDPRFGSADTAGALRDCFLRTQALIERAFHLDRLNASVSGTTVTLVVHDRVARKLIVANVGDSAACIGRIRPGSARQSEAQKITEDHKPELAEERQRIERSGGTVVFDGYVNHRVYVRNASYPGLNMSRALGDLLGHSGAGLTAEPSVSEVDLDDDDQLLMLCSDGVWDMVPPAGAVEAAAKFLPSGAAEAARHLAERAWDGWVAEGDATVVDDITAVVVLLPAVPRPPDQKAPPTPVEALITASQMRVGQINMW